MTIEELKQRIVVNTLYAMASDYLEAHKYSCEVVTDTARLCVKKVEQFVKDGTTKEHYGQVVKAWNTALESLQKLINITPSDAECHRATNTMVLKIQILTYDMKSFSERITFTDVAPAKESGEQEVKQEEVDAILDKISAQGINSLTQQEKDILANFGA